MREKKKLAHDAQKQITVPCMWWCTLGLQYFVGLMLLNSARKQFRGSWQL